MSRAARGAHDEHRARNHRRRHHPCAGRRVVRSRAGAIRLDREDAVSESDQDDIPQFLRRRNAVKCMRCLVEVPAEQIVALPRCGDPRCPLKAIPKE